MAARPPPGTTSTGAGPGDGGDGKPLAVVSRARAHARASDGARVVWVPSAANGCKEMGPWRREDLTLPANAVEAQNLTWTQLQVMAARVLGELPAGETSRETVTSAHATSATVTDNGAIE